MNYQHRPVSEYPSSSLPGPAGSSSSPRTARRTAAMRRCAPTWPRACRLPRPPPGSATPPRRCCRRCEISAPEPRDFFTDGKPGPRTAPAKDAARPRIIELRAAGHSIDEIAAVLAAEGTPLNRTGIAEVIADEGLPRMCRRRPDAERGGPAREIQARAETLDFTALARPG